MYILVVEDDPHISTRLFNVTSRWTFRPSDSRRKRSARLDRDDDV